MATEASPQRAYRAACPNCGAPVDFRSAASAFAVCGFCKSTLVREGEALRRTGASAELFDDHTPLQLGVTGTLQGVGFALVGRLQYRSTDGTWNEWHALFDNGRSGWLSEDNGRYVLAFDRAPDGPLPAAANLRPGAVEFIGSQPWTVASITQAALIAAQGELPAPPVTGKTFVVADLRDTGARVATIDYGDAAKPRWSIGQGVELTALALTGLKEESAKDLKGRAIECPSCGAALEVTLQSTQSIACHQCKAVVDVSQGVGGDLKHYAQETGAAASHEPALPLGSTGLLRLGGIAAEWQVVGYLERHDEPESGDDEVTFWREYLLYNRLQGFAFLVDAEDGWSWVRPITGVPRRLSDQKVELDGITYAKKFAYGAVTTYVLGEFYWRVARDQRGHNIDYAGTGSDRRKQLNREQSGDEITWSRGEALDAAELAKAFKLDALRQSTAGALSSRLQGLNQLKDLKDLGSFKAEGGSAVGKVVIVFVVLVLMMVLLSRCDTDCEELRQTYGASSQEYQNCQRSGGSSWRSSGSSWGGYSGGGGGHK